MIKFSNEKLAGMLLSFFVYSCGFNYVFSSIISPTLSSLLIYFLIIAMSIFAAISIRRVNTKVMIFCIVYIVFAVVNSGLVTYPYYVLVEAFTGLINMLLPILVVGSQYFFIKKFVRQWFRLAVILSLSMPAIIYLYKLGYINYGVFTYVSVPNIIILGWVAINNEKNKILYKYIVLALLNLMVVLLFGGRMAAFSALFSICMSFLMCPYISFYKKITGVCFFVFTLLLVYYNINDVLVLVYELLNRYDLFSRNIYLIMEQLNSVDGDIYLTSRDYIYDITWQYIIDRYGFPGGFGVTLFLTDGRIYHPHNFFLQIFSIVGIVGGIIFICCIAYRFIYLRKLFSAYDYKFMLIILLDYFVISLSGASILSNYLSLIGFSLLFLYTGE